MPGPYAGSLMSEMGHEQTSNHVRVMSVIFLKADIHQRGEYVCFVPLADIIAVMNWPRSEDPTKHPRLYDAFLALF